MPSVVLLLSDKRSGSTMFQDELCRHPDVQTVPSSPHSNLETHWWLMAAVLLGRDGRLFAGGRTYRGYGSRGNARAYMIDLLARSAPGFDPPRDAEALVFEGWEAMCRALARPVFFEKSPQFLANWAALSLIIEWLGRTEFDVRIVGLVRNPHGTLYSAARLFGTDPELRQFDWLDMHRNLLAFEQMLPAGIYMRVRYEALVADAQTTFAEICRFCGVPPDDRVGAGTRPGSREKWRRDPAYRLELDRAVAQMAHQLGYTDPELGRPRAATAAAAPEGPLRRRSLRLVANRLRDRLVQPMLLRMRNARR